MKQVLLLLLFCSPASASELIFLNPGNTSQAPSKIEFSTPEGGVCRKTAARKPELIVGGSFGRPATLTGDQERVNDQIFNDGTYLSDPVPTFGVALRIPLGKDNLGSCQGMITVLDATTRVESAERLFEKGLITQEELEKVASRAYSILSDF